jgi:hypothetical protein
MLGAKNFTLIALALTLGLALILGAVFRADGAQALTAVGIAWGLMSVIGVFGGALAVNFHGNPGAGFPLTVVTCILLRLFSGLGGILIAVRLGHVNAYLIGLFSTFFLMSAFEMFWFLRRNRVIAAETQREAIG